MRMRTDNTSTKNSDNCNREEQLMGLARAGTASSDTARQAGTDTANRIMSSPREADVRLDVRPAVEVIRWGREARPLL